MSIQKKSLISTLKTAKKANVASSSTNEIETKGSKISSMVKITPKGAFRLRGTSFKSTKVSPKTAF